MLNYSGPRARQIGHKKYDDILRLIIESVCDNMSREDLVSLFLEELVYISSASAATLLSVKDKKNTDGSVQYSIYGKDCWGIHANRWKQFIEGNSSLIPENSIIYEVIENGTAIDVWGTFFFKDEFDPFKYIFDIKKGGWVSAIQLPRATARHDNQGIFLWYSTGKKRDMVPYGAEQDWRLLGLFKHCYGLAGYNIRKAAKDIIMQRQELLRTLTPSILNHEINARITFFKSGLQFAKEDINDFKNSSKIGSTTNFDELLNNISSIIDDQLIPHAERLNKISESVMGLTRRIASGPTDPIAEVEAAVDLLNHRANSKSVSIIFRNLPENNVEIKSDPALLMHVIVNLVKNAIEALEEIEINDILTEKNIWIDIEWCSPNDDDLPLKIIISDNGIGVPEDSKERIFEAGITTKMKGHGLGLSICKIVSGYLGGELKLVSLRNPTSFRLSLPRSSPKIADLEEELKDEVENP